MPDPDMICFMVYQNADNNLEPFILKDVNEIINAPAIKDEKLITWIHIDRFDTNGEPLQNVQYPDGTKLQSKFDGTHYLTYDHATSRMIIDAESKVEQDSDSLDAMFMFMNYALEDCVNKGASQYFLVFSSHGGGFLGFGGDKNPDDQVRRLVQANSNIAFAIQFALDSVDGAPGKLDVLGFDACQMSSLVAAKQYSNVTRYFLASEANEPGHGWAYNSLSDLDSALDMAKDLQAGFLEHKNEQGLHETPKTLAVTDTSKYLDFHEAMEELANELTSLLQNESDQDLSAFLQRSRVESVAFDSIFDTPGSRSPTAVDIGSFFQTFGSQCSPKSTGRLRSLLDTAMSKYNNMYAVRGVGPGTKPGTGMHVIFPTKQSYNDNSELFDLVLFDEEITDFSVDAPKWTAFLQAFLGSKTPTETAGRNSICENSALSSAITDENKDRLLYNPTWTRTEKGTTVQSDLAIRADKVYVDYGTVHVFTPERRRALEAAIADKAISARSFVAGSGQPHHRIKSRAKRLRKLQSDGDVEFVIIQSGDIEGTYDGATFSATWGNTFWFLSDNEGTVSTVYVSGQTNGAMFIPVVYFAGGIQVDWSFLDKTLSDGLAMGGINGVISFGVDPLTGETSDLTLYGKNSDDESGVISEIPRGTIGSVVPIITVEYFLASGHGTIDALGDTAFPWTPGNTMSASSLPAADFMEASEAAFVVIGMYAADLDIIDTSPDGAFDLELFLFEADDLAAPPPGTALARYGGDDSARFKDSIPTVSRESFPAEASSGGQHARVAFVAIALSVFHVFLQWA